MTSSGAALDGAATPSSSSSAAPDRMTVKEPAPTTSPEIAMLNFRAHVDDVERHLRETPTDLTWQIAMQQAKQEEVGSLGIFSSLDRIVELGDRIPKDHPKEPRALMARASARGAIHDFKGAKEALDQAAKLGAKSKDIESARAGLALALGDYDAAHAVYSARIGANPTTNDLIMDGVCLAAMGKTEEADRAMQRAEELYRDVSPFLIAWLYFERGNVWRSADKPELAKAYYRVAIARLPQYAHAVLHLAELAPAEGKPLIEELAKTADDPEVMEWISIDKAKGAYEAWMKKYPLAFADHAGWFYLEKLHEPERAIDAAKINLQNRKTPEAYELLLAAKVAAKVDACAEVKEASALKYTSRALREQIAAASKNCSSK